MVKKPWVLIPTALRDHVWDTFKSWIHCGYHLGLLTDGLGMRDLPLQESAVCYGDLLVNTPYYPGVWRSWNILAKTVLSIEPNAVMVLVGDDMLPDPNKSGPEIREEYLKRFPLGEGVMQPCGDPQGKDANGVPAAARICGSPWVGSHWAHAAYAHGPVNEEYQAFFADEELKLVAEKRGALWMRPDLTQKHLHWSWGHMARQDYHERNQAVWEKDKALFDSRFGGAK